MKFDQFMPYFKINNFIKKFYKNCGPKTSSRSFCVCKDLSTTSIGNWNFWSNLLILDIRAYSSSSLRAIITCNHLPLFNRFSNFVQFCPNFQIYCPFLPFFNISLPFFCPFSEKPHACLFFYLFIIFFLSQQNTSSN